MASQYAFKSTKRVQHGFTLLELIVVLAIISILLGFAAPGLRGTIARNQLLGQANELAGALALTRSAAVTRGSQVGICASANGTTCSGKASDWNEYMLVFVDADRGSDFDNAEPVLKSYDAHDEVTHAATVASFYFRDSGFSTSNAVQSIEICHEILAENNRCRTVQIAPSGIVTVKTTTKKA